LSDSIRTTMDSTRLERVYLEYKDRVSMYINSRIRSACDAEDLISCVFEEIVRCADAYDSAKSSFSTWIYAITRNTVNNHLRHVYKTGPFIPYEDVFEDKADDGPDIEDEVIREDQLGQLTQTLKLLPKREQEIIILRFYYDKPSKEVAGLMNLSDENVRYLQNKAVKKLRVLMDA
jgi:RNA polymerase sigma-70 factor, ECF subfamily